MVRTRSTRVAVEEDAVHTPTIERSAPAVRGRSTSRLARSADRQATIDAAVQAELRRQTDTLLQGFQAGIQAQSAVTVPHVAPSTSQPQGGGRVPDFDPQEKGADMGRWLGIVDQLALVYGWSSPVTMMFATEKLMGHAKRYVQSLDHVNQDWPAFKSLLLDVFPPTRNASELYSSCLSRVKLAGESYSDYYFEKLLLIQRCKNIDDETAVSFIINGIGNESVANGARAGNHRTPSSLYKFLCMVPNATSSDPKRHRDRYSPYPKSSSNVPSTDKTHAKGKPTNPNVECFNCHTKGHYSNKCPKALKGKPVTPKPVAPVVKGGKQCNYCKKLGHIEADCYAKKNAAARKEKVLLVNVDDREAVRKYLKPAFVNGVEISSQIDSGSSCTAMQHSVAKDLGLKIDDTCKSVLYGYNDTEGTVSLGVTEAFNIRIDEVIAEIKANVVSDCAQDVALLIGRNFTELPTHVVIKTPEKLIFKPCASKVVLYAQSDVSVPVGYLVHVPVYANNFVGEMMVESGSVKDCIVPNVVLHIGLSSASDLPCAVIPILNQSSSAVCFQSGQEVAIGWNCYEDLSENVNRVSASDLKTPITVDLVDVKDVPEKYIELLLLLLNKYRDVIALSTDELGKAKSCEIEIQLSEQTPFTYRPYRMSRSEQDMVREMVGELLAAGIVRESHSAYASPVLLVKKKTGEMRLCIDYRKLNSLTVKESHPLPRIDDQIDRLSGGVYFTSLDLKAGYHQIPVAEQSRQYTAFVVPDGQYEYCSMPFGLTNAPRVFQRFMNRVLAPVRSCAAAYLDDILLHSADLDAALQDLESVLKVLRDEGLTLNLKKCAFLQRTASFLGFEVSAGQVKPGSRKIDAVKDFPRPVSVHNVRQFLGLTGYFRHFIKDYASKARPLTLLLQKDLTWSWGPDQENAFQALQKELCSRPVLAIYDPDLPTEVHTDASKVGLGGILMQKQTDGKLHPVAYFSRQTHGAEPNYHSYELETLAVVETLKKFRSYLLGLNFVVVTDCNSLKAAAKKKELVPRIARWWLQLLEFAFTVEYQSGDKNQAADALSRNPIEKVMRITMNRIVVDDWVLAGQMMDEKLQAIKSMLETTPKTDEEKKVHKEYVLKNSRVYRVTPKGPLWVVPAGMRHEIVRIAHEAVGHCSVDKTLSKLKEIYWFPRMRDYVGEFVKCCIRCLFCKRKLGKKEGYAHMIPKGKVPMDTVHVDHTGPFVRSKKLNMHLLVVVDGFTKFVFLKAVRNTKTKFVIEFLRDLFATYGTPKTIVSDQGSAFTSKTYRDFCSQNHIHPTFNAVATPRANGQVERINRSLKSAIMAIADEESRWDEKIADVKFALNNTVNSTTGKTPSQLLLGYTPRGGEDAPLRDAVEETSRLISNLDAVREEAATATSQAQKRQKKYFDQRRKKPKTYEIGDLVLIEKQATSEPGVSRKTIDPYQGPMVVQAVLPNDRYRVADLQGTCRSTRRVNYDRVVAVDRMKPYNQRESNTGPSYLDVEDDIVQGDSEEDADV